MPTPTSQGAAGFDFSQNDIFTEDDAKAIHLENGLENLNKDIVLVTEEIQNMKQMLMSNKNKDS